MTESQSNLKKELFYRHLYDGGLFIFSFICAIFILVSSQERSLVPYRLFICICPVFSTMVLQLLLNRFPKSRILWLLRYTTPLLFLTFFFRLTGQIFPVLPRGYFDEWMLKLDELFFGDPKISLHFQGMDFVASNIFGEIMCASYILYYLFIPFFCVMLLFKNLWKQRGPSYVFAWYVAAVTLTYYAHYLFFFLFPVEGPAFYLGEGVTQNPGFLFAALRHLVSSNFDVPGGGFPSSHVAIAIFHCFIAAQFKWRKTFVVSILITAGICLSTVYTQAHYAIDSIMGLFSGTLCWIMFRWIEDKTNLFLKTGVLTKKDMD